jgi:hypothetical protein
MALAGSARRRIAARAAVAAAHQPAIQIAVSTSAVT